MQIRPRHLASFWFPLGIPWNRRKGSDGSEFSCSYAFFPENPRYCMSIVFLYFCCYIIFSVYWWFPVICLFTCSFIIRTPKLESIIETTFAIIIIWFPNCSFPWIRKLTTSYEYLSRVSYLSSLTLGWVTMENS